MTLQSLSCAFDRSGKVRRPARSLILGEARSLFTTCPPPDPSDIRHGGGHVVLLVPGLFTGDAVMRPLRQFLDACGYRGFGWELGVNWGPTQHAVTGLQQRLTDLREIEGGPVSVVGLSLGGLLARDLAYQRPDDVRQVITIASPFRLPTATVLEPIIRMCARWYSADVDLERLASPLPVPSAAIYSRQDGIVAWESCCGDEANCASVEVAATHFTACRDAEVLRAVAQRLGECPGQRQQFTGR
jgi:pimeloyl-ACP methyl ester carboxylesterase